MSGHVVAIHLSRAGAEAPFAVTSVRAVPGRGLEGDRYFEKRGTFSTPGHKPDAELTLIESEVLETLAREAGIALAPGASRRNITTRGVSLNDLVGKQFRIGEVQVRGLRLCEPCAHLEKLTEPGIVRSLAHRGGLRAQVLTDGVIRTGDIVAADRSVNDALTNTRSLSGNHPWK